MIEVSYCIAVMNGAKHLRETLESILAQDHAYSFEVVLSDDESTDESMAIARDVLEGRAPYTLLAHLRQGIGANWNHALRHAKGTYIALVGQDDVLQPHFTKVLREHIDARGLTAAFGWRGLIDASGKTIYSYRLQIRSDFPDVIDYRWVMGDRLLYGAPRNFIGEPCCFLFHRDHFEKTGYFDSELQQLIDLEYWFRSFKWGLVGCTRSEVSSFRLHADQATERNEKRRIIDSYRFPLMVFQQHREVLHPKTKRLLVKKIFTGWIRYYLLRA